MGEKQRYKVIVSDRAKQMLGVHIRFLAQVNKEAAAEKKKQIMTALRYLAQMPQRLPFVDEEYLNQSQYHKMYVEKWYFVLYQILDDTVYVEYIFDCRKDYHWLIR